MRVIDELMRRLERQFAKGIESHLAASRR
jgi:hypothetical protein